MANPFDQKTDSLPADSSATEQLEKEYPLPKETVKYEDLTTDEMFLALQQKLKREKAIQMLKIGHKKFSDLKERMGPQYVMDKVNGWLAEVGEGQVAASQLLEGGSDAD